MIILLATTPGHMQYDRIYCGAACPTEHVDLVKSLLKVGGILVFPVNNRVCCMLMILGKRYITFNNSLNL